MKQDTHDALLPDGYCSAARKAAATLASLDANRDLEQRRGGAIEHLRRAEAVHLAAQAQLRALVDATAADFRAHGITLWDALVVLREPVMAWRGDIAPGAVRAVLTDIATWVIEGYVGNRHES